MGNINFINKYPFISYKAYYIYDLYYFAANSQPTPSCDIDHILLKWNLVAEVESDEHFLRLRLEHSVCINITNKFLNKTTLICSRARRKASHEEIVCPYRMLFIPSTNSDGSTYGRGNLFAGEQHQCGFRIGIGMEHDETRRTSNCMLEH